MQGPCGDEHKKYNDTLVAVFKTRTYRKLLLNELEIWYLQNQQDKGRRKSQLLNQDSRIIAVDVT